MIGTKLYVHRLGVHEVETLLTVAQTFSKGLGQRFRNHGRWLRRVLADLMQGNRVAFGAFLETDARESLVGTILLKRGPAGLVEAKNFLVKRPDEGESEPAAHVASIQRSLLRRVELFCKQRGFSQLDVELFVHEEEQQVHPFASGVNVLLGEGFSLQSIRASSLYPSDSFYTFSKRMPASYSGDPADEVEITRWLLRDHFAFTDITGPKTAFGKEKGYCHAYTFTIPYSPGKFPIKGCCITEMTNGVMGSAEAVEILQGKDVACLPEEFQEAFKGSNIRLLISHHNGPPPAAAGIWTVGGREIDSLLGPHLVKQRREDDVGGLLLEIRRDKLAERITHPSMFGYYVVNGVGSGVYEALYDDKARRPQFALLAALERDSSGGRNALVWGVARILEIEPHPQKSAYYYLDKPLRLWDLTQYDYYVNEFTINADDDGRIYVLKLGPPVDFAEPVPVQSVLAGVASDNYHELGITTLYVPAKKLARLRNQHPGPFSDAERPAPSPGVPPPPTDESRAAALISVVVDLEKHHSPKWFHSLDSKQLSAITGAVLAWLRNSHATGREEEGDGPQMGVGGQPSLFNQDDDIKVLLWHIRDDRGKLDRAEDLLKTRTAWRLRLLGRALLDRLHLDIPDRRIKQIRQLLPSVSELINEVGTSIARTQQQEVRYEVAPQPSVVKRLRGSIDLIFQMGVSAEEKAQCQDMLAALDASDDFDQILNRAGTYSPPPQTRADARNAVEAFLISAFTPHELAQFAGGNDLLTHIKATINWNANVKDLVQNLLGAIERHGLDWTAFFGLLREARPNRSDQIDRLAASWRSV